MVDDEVRRPGHPVDGRGEHVAMGTGVVGKEEFVEGVEEIIIIVWETGDGLVVCFAADCLNG